MNVRSLQFLQISLQRIDDCVRRAVSLAQAVGHDPTDALRGLIISQEEVDGHLEQLPLAGLWPDDDAFLLPLDAFSEEDPDLPFLHLIDTFDLTVIDGYILLLCLAPELDRRYERLYAFLQDDVSQRRPTVNLVMNLLGGNVPQRFAVWERLMPDKPLRAHHLVECLPDPGRPHSAFLAYQLKVNHRIVAHLLGDDNVDEGLRNIVRRVDDDEAILPLPDSVIAPIRVALPECPLVYMQGAADGGQRETAAALCAAFMLPLVEVGLTQLAALDMPFDTAWRLALREGYLANAALLLDGWESCLDDEQRPPAAFWTALLSYEKPVFLCGQETWEPSDVQRTRRLLRITFETPAYTVRQQVWKQAASREGIQIDADHIEELAGKFRFSHHQIVGAVHTAADMAASRGETVVAADLFAGAQAHAGLQLGHMARRIMPRYTWHDLILPPEKLTHLREMSMWAHYAHVVLDDWGFGEKITHTQGVSALFAGESGTGKTLAAEVIANDLGLALYKIDLSAVVSKYIGETEKNLSTIFDQAQSSNAILFFDEADALFGKRSEVKDAHDRYANIEIAYLLQRIEDYDGTAILATNLRQNLDDAFTRRLDFLIDFPFPESEYRRQIWSRHFPAEAPLSPDVNLDEIAERYHLAGGNIRNAVIGAAYLAAADGGVITLKHIRSAIRREHQKIGRLLDND